MSVSLWKAYLVDVKVVLHIVNNTNGMMEVTMIHVKDIKEMMYNVENMTKKKKFFFSLGSGISL